MARLNSLDGPAANGQPLHRLKTRSVAASTGHFLQQTRLRAWRECSTILRYINMPRGMQNSTSRWLCGCMSSFDNRLHDRQLLISSAKWFLPTAPSAADSFASRSWFPRRGSSRPRASAPRPASRSSRKTSSGQTPPSQERPCPPRAGLSSSPCPSCPTKKQFWA